MPRQIGGLPLTSLCNPKKVGFLLNLRRIGYCSRGNGDSVERWGDMGRAWRSLHEHRTGIHRLDQRHIRIFLLVSALQEGWNAMRGGMMDVWDVNKAWG